MIQTIDFQNVELVKTLFNLQRDSYVVEAELINFYEIPPLMESFEDFQKCTEQFLGYFENLELAGAVSYELEGDELTICRLVVDPGHFKKGIAQKLLDAVESSNADASLIKVSTGKDNVPAKNLYLKNKFNWIQDLEVVPNLYISLFEKKVGHESAEAGY
ncbi:GNAT family N-acetyltransferase [Paenibacillus caui]|uniref:GNAT family N-acetyltransferase n=1 Tax=Paenibacillus caui TaxID=2873927 RepID=UPI001CA98C03|nr:GNAT family N-acetyltransferase [Paenibacillus caui]